VLKIGDVTAEEALRRALEITPADNDMTRADRAPFWLTMPTLLEALGICRDGANVAFEVRTVAGATERFTARAAADTTGTFNWFFEGESLPLPGARTAHDGAARAAPPPSARSGARVLVRVAARAETALRPAAPRRARRPWRHDRRLLRAHVRVQRQREPAAFVLDIRHNHGGDNTLLRPLIHGLIRREGGINTAGACSRSSAAAPSPLRRNCANWIEEHTNTLFVGEPTGGRPNHYGDNQPVPLPHHPDLLVFVSHWPWQARLPWDDRPWIAPHIAAPLTSADYRENRDPALAAILAYRSEPTLSDQLRAKVLAGGRDAAAGAYQGYVRAHPDRWGRTCEAEVDALGYALLRAGKTAEAVAILGLNAERYPGSANTWDSLAEATLAAGDRAEAERLYRKALAIDPDLRSAQRALARLSDH
jgi:hypothetical protein